MFRKVTVLCLTCFGLFAVIWFFQFCWVRQSDFRAYEAFMKQQEIAASPQSFASSTEQTREGVRKDIWFSQDDGSRLNYRIESASSVLSLVPKQRNFKIVEHLQKIKCMMQDKFFVAAEGKLMQQVRFLEADQGTYYYANQQFLAQSVTLSLFRLPGNTLPLECDPKLAFIKGVAQDVTFAVTGKTPQFQAQNFKAHFKPQTGGL